MKSHRLILIIGFVVLNYVSQSQSKLSTYVEKTQISTKIGTAFTYEFADFTEVGIFYQKSANEIEKEYGRPLQGENEFSGLIMAYPLHVGEVWLLKINSRMGIVNRQHFNITPSIKAEYFPMAGFSFDAGVGIRNFRPTLQAGIKINL